jgi:dolichol-phosphate mannosyltransferase
MTAVPVAPPATALEGVSIVLPCHDEAPNLIAAVKMASEAGRRNALAHEVIVVDDGSRDATREIVDRIAASNPRVRCHPSHYERGFGFAVRAGLDEFSGDAVAIVMADASDDPEDLVRYHRLLAEGWDCAFGSRFIHGAHVHAYPLPKLLMNRLANWFIRVLFRHRYNDTTNAFKAYRREVIETISPLLSNHFNLTVEMPLKAIVRGHSYRVIPISWRNRTSGTAKLALREMGSRYVFIVLYVWLEHTLSRGDYRRSGMRGDAGPGPHAVGDLPPPPVGDRNG